MQDNFSFSTVTADQMRVMTRDVAGAKPDAIAIICTNMRGAPLAEELEAAYGIPIYDTVSTTVWKSLKIAGVDTARVKAWGKLFAV
jgi:maleate isomerase